MASDKDDLVPDGREHELIEGAAEDSAASEDELAKLPRLLRYAVLAARGVTSASWSVAAEIVEISPDLSEAYAWCLIPESATGIGLAAVLDHRAVAQDRSEMRALADCVRLLSLSLPRDKDLIGDYRRVARAACIAAQARRRCSARPCRRSGGRNLRLERPSALLRRPDPGLCDPGRHGRGGSGRPDGPLPHHGSRSQIAAARPEDTSRAGLGPAVAPHRRGHHARTRSPVAPQLISEFDRPFHGDGAATTPLRCDRGPGGRIGHHREPSAARPEYGISPDQSQEGRRTLASRLRLRAPRFRQGAALLPD